MASHQDLPFSRQGAGGLENLRGSSSDKPERYDAFLSYAHEDEVTVSWLYQVLTSYWVPGKKKRRLYQDKRRIIAGSLDDQIKEALAVSRYLIVCWSKSISASPWVGAEVQYFLKCHPPDRVLICRVEAKSESPSAPGFLSGLLRDTAGNERYIPDLRGAPAKAKGRERREYIETALALLAPLVDLKDRDEVLSTRKKRQRLVAALVITVSLLAASAFGVWRWWLTTPDGLLHQAVGRLNAAASNFELNDPLNLIPTARALGQLNRRDLIEPFARFASDRDFKALFLAAGYASLPMPACQDAEKALAGVDSSMAALWPQSAILTAKSCGGSWLEQVLPRPVDDGAIVRQASLLARFGFPERAESMLAKAAALPVADRLDVTVEIVAAFGHDVPEPIEPILEQWAQSQAPEERLHQGVHLLEGLDVGGLLGSTSLAQRLLELSLVAADFVADDAANAWELKQQLAAHLAHGNREVQATALLAATDPGTIDVATDLVYEDASVGWAWRGLANLRLGVPDAAQAAFSKAEGIARKPRFQTRTWGEWAVIARVHVLAGNWEQAFRAAEEPLDEHARILQRMALIQLWAQRKVVWPH